jgi:type II secretory pathway component PulM
MMDAVLVPIGAWWRGLTARERLMLTGGAILVFLILLPLWGYQSASAFRRDAAARLEAARTLRADVARLKALGPAPRLSGDVRTLALESAQAVGLTPTRIEQRGGDQFVIVFEPADSLMAYRWIDLMGRGGALVQRTALARVGEDGIVSAEFEVAAGP